jgi:hypothetical protein
MPPEPAAARAEPREVRRAEAKLPAPEVPVASATGGATASAEPPPPNRGAMLAALAAAAGSASGCRRAGGPSGPGRASVTFAPSGTVTGVTLSGGFAGTPVGACVAGAFKGARVPPFGGSPVTVGRGFVVPE